jgi:hypothetical protein
VFREVTVNRIEDRALVVPLGSVAGNPRQAQLIQHRRNVLVLKFDGMVSPAYPSHEALAVAGFDVALSRKVGRQHSEIVGDNCIEFIALPMRPKLCFGSHFSPVMTLNTFALSDVN